MQHVDPERPPSGRVVQINVSKGGVPKRSVPSAQVTRGGVAGDRQHDLRYHGGPERAVSCFALEIIERLAHAGHPIAPGTAGENLTLAGLDWRAVQPGARLRFAGGVVLQVTSFAAPCPTIRASFVGGDYELISEKQHRGESRVYCRVLAEGEVRAGESVELDARGPESGAATTVLEPLHAALLGLLARDSFADTVARLKQELERTSESFVWATLELEGFSPPLPPSIRSGWIFVLRADLPSGAHFHPNSVQHMALVRGQGSSNVGGVRRRMLAFDAPSHALAERWHVIPQGVPHEFFPEREPMVVVSFHTAAPDALQEVACDSGAVRVYESPRRDR